MSSASISLQKIMAPIVLLALLLIPYTGRAQFEGVATGASLTTIPTTPPPNSDITVTLNAFSVNTNGATIQWFVDGIENTEARNARSIEVQSQSLGENTRVEAVITPTDSPRFSVPLTISPAVIDVIIEADTHIPTFYKGRALPSPNAPLRIIAIPHDGSGSPATAYSYKWELNNKTLRGGTIKGDPSLEIEMPTFKNTSLKLTVYNSGGLIVGKRFILLNSEEPELLFYEENPLRGIRTKAITDSLVLTGEEVTVRAEPYFVDKALSGVDNNFEWRVDGVLVQNTNTEPNTITLRRSGGEGSARVGFKMNNLKKIFQFVENSFSITF